jgi:alcohol dehydrogenase class IV
MAEAAIRQLLPCLRPAVLTPTPAVREQMARGAHLAGRAIDISRTTAAHALSYGLTSDLGVPHGHAVALLLPSIVRINFHPEDRRILDRRGAAHLAETMERVRRILGCRDGEETALFLEGLLADLGLATRVASRSPGSAVLATRLMRKVNAERLGNNPVALSELDVFDAYARLLERDPVAAVA